MGCALCATREPGKESAEFQRERTHNRSRLLRPSGPSVKNHEAQFVRGEKKSAKKEFLLTTILKKNSRRPAKSVFRTRTPKKKRKTSGLPGKGAAKSRNYRKPKESLHRIPQKYSVRGKGAIEHHRPERKPAFKKGRKRFRDSQRTLPKVNRS